MAIIITCLRIGNLSLYHLSNCALLMSEMLSSFKKSALVFLGLRSKKDKHFLFVIIIVFAAKRNVTVIFTRYFLLFSL